MRTILAALCVIVVTLLITVLGRISFASDPTDAGAKVASTLSVVEANPEVPAAHDPIAAEYERLGVEYEKLANAREEVIPLDFNEPADLTLSDDEWLRLRREAQAKAPNPDALLPQFVAFAKNHPKSPLAFDAVFFVVRQTAFREFRGAGKPSPVLVEALDLAWADHKDDPRMVHLLARLQVPSFQSESFLKRALEDAPNRTVRAAASYYLAEYYRVLANCHKRSQWVENRRALTNDDRFWKLAVTARLERHLPLDARENSRRIEDLLGQVVAEYSDVPAAKWKLSGPGWILIETAQRVSPKTYGDLAASRLNQLTNLVPGKPAPEIVGTDADGNTFRLSDYRGQVVLLTFSANWCPGCVKFYPMARRLQEKYRDRPFVILGVNRDEKIDTLKSAIAEGKITWRCWWDGIDGPIRNALNASAGSRFLLDDQHIIQDAGFSEISFEEDFARAVEPLLEKAAARAHAAQ